MPILAENTYAVDESGFWGAARTAEHVMQATGKKVQHQQGDRNRENTTVIVSICANSTSLPPAVIFKGQAFQVKWNQNNPANASVGYSKKGWMDGEIGAEWIKQCDEQTKRNAKGKSHLLLVDGHNLHYTQEFLVYAVEHQIQVLCYLAHGTHIYQGLDVVIFAVLKLYWTEAKARWEHEKGVRMDKTNFLKIYGLAHIRALTPELVHMAFHKTGVFPFDPTVVTKEMMAPSLEMLM